MERTSSGQISPARGSEPLRALQLQSAKAQEFGELWRKTVRLGGGGGGLLRGKKDRDDRRKSYKTTLKNTKP